MEESFVKLLVCPETKQPLQLADLAALATLNDSIAKGSVSNRRGDRVVVPLEALLVREDGRFGYPVRDRIPEMLIEEAIPLARP